MIADLVTEEQRGQLEWRGRRVTGAEEPEKPGDASPALSELRLKELQLQERERALKAREDRLERESGHRAGAAVQAECWCVGSFCSLL